MKYLVDTHAFLHMTSDPNRLSRKAKGVIEDRDSELLLSAASVWEMAIKCSLGKLELAAPLAEFVREQLLATQTSVINVTADHASGVVALPFHHRDPFDRLLVAQASSESIAIISADRVFGRYGINRVW